MKEKTVLFEHSFMVAEKKDIGKKRADNQDETILCPKIGFFAISDGMGGLGEGAKASEYVRQSMAILMEICNNEYGNNRNIDTASKAYYTSVQLMSDRLFNTGNSEDRYLYGATFSGVWLIENKAVFVNIGDSRGYLLSRYKKKINQVTDDQNIAGMLYRKGKLTKTEAKNDPGSSRLTSFVGMKPPADPELYIMDVHPGDRILLCSDGLYGMVEDQDIVRIMRSSKSPERVCDRLIAKANENGGRDNISAVYIKIINKA